MNHLDGPRAVEFARRLERKAIAEQARQRALAAGFDRLVLGWLSAGGPVPWAAVPQRLGARRASRAGH